MVDIKEIDMKKFFFGVVAAVMVFLVLFFGVIRPQFFAGVMRGPVLERVELVSAVTPEVVGIHVSDGVAIVGAAVVPKVQVVEQV
jgi:hypothetical protein